MKRVECLDGGPAAEVLTMEYVRQQTNIPIPATRRFVQDRLPDDTDWFYGLGLIAMEYIRGSTLRVAWPTLSFWNKLRVIWTLRQYISQLRQVTSKYSTRPGPPGGCSALPPPGMIFYGTTPPFENSDQLELWYRYTIRKGKSNGRLPRELPPFPDASPLVMTHADLDLGNIMIDESGHVWLIDFGASGYFPKWYEYITAVQIARVKKAPNTWLALLPLVTGPYFAHEAYAEQVGIVSRREHDLSFTGLYAVWMGLKSYIKGYCQ